MLDLGDVPFFAELSAASLARLSREMPRREYAQGDIIVRIGEVGRSFQAVARGVVRVLPDPGIDGDWRGVMLGPGQVFGEMSLFSGMPVSATLVAARDTVTWSLDGPAFLALLEREPALHRSLTRLLIERLRNRTRHEARRPGLAVIVGVPHGPVVRHFVDTVMRAVRCYAPGSELGVLALEASDARSAQARLRARIDHWRQHAAGGQYLVFHATPGELPLLTPLLQGADVVVSLVTPELDEDGLHRIASSAGLADVTRVYLDARPAGDPGRWSFCVAHDELHRAREARGRWDRTQYPNLDSIARYMTFKEVGIALSSGAARGFAHVGVLQVLEERGVPLDYLCGTSMGGITALTVARCGDTREAERFLQSFLGGNRKIRDTRLLPGISLFGGHKIARAASETFGSCTFADLSRPVAVVAADIAGGERAVLDRGRVAPAVLATSAIPGFFPPIKHDGRVLVDGGIVSRVPVDVLNRRRCGLKIAVNVLPSARQVPDGDPERLERLWEQMNRPLGLKRVFGNAWELLGSWGSTLEAMRADVVVAPDTPPRAGFDFDRFGELVERGRIATRERADGIVDALRAMLEG
ncbi:MAG: patatin-like phospholipase family protein [Gammaproteobacteria bacterium]|nr:patatin-like phospholipase family protein [Gammaproteobacteria bacterium]